MFVVFMKSSCEVQRMTQQTLACLKSTIETLEKGVKYVNKVNNKNINFEHTSHSFLVFLLLL